jgi:4-amino-4-deoxy-L-arabinose transferase-like glycosyltransferase
LLAALGFALATFLLRMPFVRLPFGQQDEGYYAAVARATLEGRRLYADLGYVRPPGMNAAYAAAFRLSEALGTPYDLTLRLLASLVAAATVGVLAAYLFRRFTVLPAVIGSALAALTGASLALQNEANSETWMMLPYAASAVLVLWAMERVAPPGSWRAAMVAAGALTGVAALFKEVALVNLAVPLLAALVLLAERRVRRALEATALFAAGVLVVQAGTLLAMATTGQVLDLLYYTWFTRLSYVAETHARASALDMLLLHGSPIRAALVAPLAAALIAALVAFVGRPTKRSAECRLVLLAAGWLVVSFVGVAASGRFYEHYFIQATIPVALLLAAALAAIARPGARVALTWAAAAVAIAGCAFPTYSWVTDLSRVPDLSAMRGAWRDLAERADAVTPEGGTMFVWGDFASVRAYSDVTHSADEVWVNYPFGEPGGRVALGKRFPSIGDRLLVGLEAGTPDTIVVTAQLGPYLPGRRVSALAPADDLRVERVLLEMIEADFEEAERSEQYVVFVRKR